MKNLATPLTCVNNNNVEATRMQINQFKEILTMHMNAVTIQRKQHPHGTNYTITDDALSILFKQCDSIRDSGELVNFNIVSCAVDQIEKLLNKLRMPVQYRRTDTIGDLITVLDNLEKSFNN